MKYAFVNDKAQEAQPGLVGECKCCGTPTIAKCGKKNIWHWAHRGKKMCDQWWENETEWHRAWKGMFPKEWQEIIQYAENGEKHIADVKIDQGYVIEFQHSHIKPEERNAREHFYRKMIWVVDGLRRKTDEGKFNDIISWSKKLDGNEDMRILWNNFDKCALLRGWSCSNVPVFFDFYGSFLWCLLPKTADNIRYIFRIDRSSLIESLITEQSARRNLEEILNSWNGSIKKEERYQRHLKSQRMQMFPPARFRF